MVAGPVQAAFGMQAFNPGVQGVAAHTPQFPPQILHTVLGTQPGAPLTQAIVPGAVKPL